MMPIQAKKQIRSERTAVCKIASETCLPCSPRIQIPNGKWRALFSGSNRYVLGLHIHVKRYCHRAVLIRHSVSDLLCDLNDFPGHPSSESTSSLKAKPIEIIPVAPLLFIYLYFEDEVLEGIWRYCSAGSDMIWPTSSLRHGLAHLPSPI